MTHLTYLLFEVGWAVPVLLIQWLLGGRILRSRLRPLLIAVLASTLWLSLADSIAIAQGIWTLHASRILTLRVGDLPVEEVLFFLLTNTMVVQSIILVYDMRFLCITATIRRMMQREGSDAA